eukprot:3433577-Pleurochrysis_carterae.AAC.1
MHPTDEAERAVAARRAALDREPRSGAHLTNLAAALINLAALLSPQRSQDQPVVNSVYLQVSVLLGSFMRREGDTRITVEVTGQTELKARHRLARQSSSKPFLICYTRLCTQSVWQRDGHI